MQLKTDNNSFVRFLKDEKFIEWKLLPTDELDAYWEGYLLKHPDKREDLLLADKYLKRINLSPSEILPGKKQEAILRLKQSLDSYKRKYRIRSFAYAAACAAVLLITILYIQKEITHPEKELISSSNFIVGNELESEDIVFITGNKTTSFQSNVDIHLEGDNTVQIKGENAESKEISIEEHTMNKLIIPYGKRSKIVLADGSQVWLNSGSTLEFPSAFMGDRREIFLTGEMFIEVAPDKKKPFYVHTPDYNVKVYGTKFNISSYPGSLSSVVLVEGKVSLQSEQKQELFLSPSEQAVYSEGSGTFDTRKVDVHPYICWKEGYLTFENTLVTEALKQIERYYNLAFNYDDNISFQGLTCTGKVILSDNLDNVMTTLSLISSTKYNRENKTIYIYKD